MKSYLRALLTLCLVASVLLSIALPVSAAGAFSPATGDPTGLIMIIVGIVLVVLVIAVILIGKKKDKFDE